MYQNTCIFSIKIPITEINFKLIHLLEVYPTKVGLVGKIECLIPSIVKQQGFKELSMEQLI